MIVSHRLRLIFIKTRKTAGTSIEIGLAPFCGDADILTRDTAADQAIRNALGYPGPQNEYGIALRHYRAADWRRLVLRGQRARFKNHMPATRVRALVGETVWRTYYKVSVERNPWDRAVSLYYWRTRAMRPRPPFLEFVGALPERSLSNYSSYGAAHGVLVDHVMRYESLSTELEALRGRLGLDRAIVLPRAKSAQRPPQTHYAALFTPAARAIVEAACAREIALLDYQYQTSAEDA